VKGRQEAFNVDPIAQIILGPSGQVRPTRRVAAEIIGGERHRCRAIPFSSKAMTVGKSRLFSL
jgi:hypothetical protein